MELELPQKRLWKERIELSLSDKVNVIEYQQKTAYF